MNSSEMNILTDEAVIGVIKYLFNSLKKHRVIASADPRNTKSITLLERMRISKD